MTTEMLPERGKMMFATLLPLLAVFPADEAYPGKRGSDNVANMSGKLYIKGL